MNTLAKVLLFFAAPGERLPDNAAQPPTLEAAGMGWGWALFLGVTLTVTLAAVYWRFARKAPPVWRVTLMLLKTAVVLLLVLMLVKPVLHVTIDESARQTLVVLLDQSQSMELADQREALADVTRAALAKGEVEPSAGLNKPPGESASAALRKVSRKQVLDWLAANEKLALWQRLHAQTTLTVYGFGAQARLLGELSGANGAKLATRDAADFFAQLKYPEPVTALGDSLRQVLDEQRGQPLAGILVITDGANNAGATPLAAAAVAKQDGVPLYLYGAGVSNPQDIMVSALSGPPVLNVKEQTAFTVQFKTLGMAGKRAVVQLKADGKIVDEQPLDIRADGEQEVALNFTPDTTGLAELEAVIPPLPGEAVRDNNSASAKARVVDDKINVLVIQQEPDWDFQYVLSLLLRDRRAQVKCAVVKGDRTLFAAADSPYLAELPADKKALFRNDIIILADVDPTELGAARMELLREWVDKAGGGLIVIAGAKFLPRAYAGTPLAPLLPVEPESARPVKRYDKPVPLTLTAAGELSPLLTLSERADENRALWKKFPGVTWTAWVGAARPAAQVLLTDPTAERATRSGPMPVLAAMNYGLGQVLYVGTNQTYRWRSESGEKYFARLWGQFFQVLSNQKMLGNTLTQLRSDKLRYVVGERVRVTGRLFKPGFEPLLEAEAPGRLAVKSSADGQPQTSELRLKAVAERPGEYRAEFAAAVAGEYTFITARDAGTVLKFEVEEPRVEQSDIAMNEKLLREMASASGGLFLREEDLNGLPEQVRSRTVSNVTFKTIPLNFSPWLLAVMVGALSGEWWLRRKMEMK